VIIFGKGIKMVKTVKVACEKSPNGFFVQNADKVPLGTKLFTEANEARPPARPVTERRSKARKL